MAEEQVPRVTLAERQVGRRFGRLRARQGVVAHSKRAGYGEGSLQGRSIALSARVTRLQANRRHLCCNDELLRSHGRRED
jgi:hypothetical protein